MPRRGQSSRRTLALPAAAAARGTAGAATAHFCRCHLYSLSAAPGPPRFAAMKADLSFEDEQLEHEFAKLQAGRSRQLGKQARGADGGRLFCTRMHVVCNPGGMVRNGWLTGVPSHAGTAVAARMRAPPALPTPLL